MDSSESHSQDVHAEDASLIPADNNDEAQSESGQAVDPDAEEGSEIESLADYPEASYEPDLPDISPHDGYREDNEEEASDFPQQSVHDKGLRDGDDESADFPEPSAVDTVLDEYGDEEEANFPPESTYDPETPGKEVDAEADYPKESAPDLDIPALTDGVDRESSYPAQSKIDLPDPSWFGMTNDDDEEASYPEPSKSAHDDDDEEEASYPEASQSAHPRDDQRGQHSEHDDIASIRRPCKKKMKPYAEEPKELEGESIKEEEVEEAVKEKTKREKEREQKCREEFEAWLQLAKDDHLLSYAFDDVNLPRRCQTSTDRLMCRKFGHFLDPNDISRIQQIVRIYDQNKQIQTWISSHQHMNRRIKELRVEMIAAKKAAKDVWLV